LERRPPARRVSIVAQICNLLYRRIAFCESRIFLRPSRKRSLADCKSAIQQITNLRYVRAGPGAGAPSRENVRDSDEPILQTDSMTSKSYAVILAVLALATQSCLTQTQTANANAPAYLFATFKEPEQDGLRFAWSYDGYHWTNVPGVFLEPTVGDKIMRDPSVARGTDGTWHAVWTSAWHGGFGFGYAQSKDLVHWTGQKLVPAMTNEPTTVNVWAPELFYDEHEKQFIICWASTIPGRFPDHLEPHDNNHRMYFTTTRDFETFTPTKLFYDPDFSVIDCQILKDDSRYVLLLKDNTRPQRNLRVAFGDTPLGPWRNVSTNLTEKFTEGPAALKIGKDWIIYYEAYQAKQYRAMKTRDFKTFTDITDQVVFPPGLKHGTPIVVSRSELDRVVQSAPK
jgi:hypothetical protein